MNINMKYYIITIASIFLALGIGIIVGFNLNYDQKLSKEQNEVLNEFEARFDSLSKENELLKASNDKLEDYISKNYSILIQNELNGRNTGIILTNEKSDYSEEIQNTISEAGGSLAFNILVKDNVGDKNILKELSTKVGQEITTSEQCVNYIVDCINGENATEALAVLESLELIEVKYLNEASLAYDSVVLIGEDEEENIKESFEAKEKNIISKLKSDKIYVVAVQREESKSEFISLCNELNISTINNIDTEIGKISLDKLIKDEIKIGKFGIGEDVDDLMYFSK